MGTSAVFGLGIIDLARSFVLRTDIFPASYGTFVMDAALECRAVKVRAVAIRILRHIVRPFGIIFVKTFFHFLLSEGEDIGAAVRPA